jgi:hypothetical protein
MPWSRGTVFVTFEEPCTLVAVTVTVTVSRVFRRNASTLAVVRWS